MILLAGMVSACAAPVDTLSEMDLAPDAPRADAVAGTAGGGLFSGVLRRAAEALPPLPEGMLRPMARGQDPADEATKQPAADSTDTSQAEGFFARLARRNAEARAAREAEALAAQEQAAVARMARQEAAAMPDRALDLSHPLAVLRPKARTTSETGAAASEAEPKGFFARLAARSKAREAAKAQAETEKVALAALPKPKAEAPSKQPEPKQPEPQVKGVTLPGLGDLVPVCGLSRRALGTQVARYPEKGRVRYAVYDSQPGQAGPRVMSITGFKDGCPRQIMAALALFGNFEMHEQVRYLLPASAKPYSDTDTAYETLKAKTCGTKTREPCGRKMPRLARNGVFLSLYERLGQGAWANILLHEGQVLAVEGK